MHRSSLLSITAVRYVQTLPSPRGQAHGRAMSIRSGRGGPEDGIDRQKRQRHMPRVLSQ